MNCISVPVVDDHLRLLFSILHLLDEPLHLLADPGGIEMQSGFSNDDFPRFQEQKYQYVQIMDSLGGHRLDAKEVSTPERFAVPFEEVGPRVRRTIRAGFNLMLLQDIPNGLPTDVGDAQLAKIADDAG